MSSTGKVVRFDEEKGYGFIVADLDSYKGSDEEDLFFHVNGLRMEKSVLRPGLRVVFDARNGDRGKYAVNIVDAGPAGADWSTSGVQGADPDGRVWAHPTREELLDEFTELIITAAPEVPGREIVSIRQGFVALAEKYGWITRC